MEAPRYGMVEEVLNCVTHGIGAALSVAGLTLLVTFAAFTGDPWRIVSFAIFGTTLVVLYVSSTLYHSIPGPNAKRILRRLDHASIFLLIAGTYTPFSLVLLGGGAGWIIFSIVWALAAFGVVIKIGYTGRFEVLTLCLYLGMGWLGVTVMKPIIAVLPAPGLALLVGGGLAYTFGVIFYVGRRIPYNHAIWHLFVMAGSTCHFFAIMLFVL